jgi:hypothetical protein
MKFKFFFTQMSLHLKKKKNISVYVNEKILTISFLFFHLDKISIRY